LSGVTDHISRVTGCAGSLQFDLATALHLANRWADCRDPSIPIDEYVRTERGGFADVAAVRAAIYVICDYRSNVLYVGKCQRLSTSVEDRLRGHDAVTDDAYSVIVIPLEPSLSEDTVASIEAAFIHQLSPPYNVQRRRRTA
jgi:hypothetical protein